MSYRTYRQKGSTAADVPTSPTRLPRLLLQQLEEKHYSIPSHGEVICRLWRLRSDPCRSDSPAVYAVGMDGLGYRRLYCLGRDEARAREVFVLLVRKTVTPCVLKEILDELT